MMKVNRNRPWSALGATLGLSCLCGGLAKAQDVVTPMPVVDKSYRIGIEDVLSITAPGHEDITQDTVVLPDGYIHINGLQKPIYADGKTIAQIQADIFKGLDRLYNNLEITVKIREATSQSVIITGARSSGRYPLRKKMRISTLMALSGGPPGQLKYAVANLLRDDQVIKLDLVKILGQEPDPKANMALQPGDEIIIDMKEVAPPPTYSVLGSVSKGGAFPMPLDGSPISIARAIAEAGGKNEHAALSKVILERDGAERIIDLYPLLTEGRADSEVAKLTMKDGDVLIVPEIKRKYFVTGQANRPGTFYMPEEKEIRVIDAISEAGGASGNGEQRKVTVTRIVNGKPVTLSINLLNVYTKGMLSKNYLIQDQDVVFIPGRSVQVDPTQQYLNPLFTFTSLYNSGLFR